MTKEEILKEYYNTWFYYFGKETGMLFKCKPIDPYGGWIRGHLTNVVDDNGIFINSYETRMNYFGLNCIPVWELTENASKEDFDD